MIETEPAKGLGDWDVLVIRNEREFCSYLEARLRDAGFELLETSPIGGWGACMSAGAF